MNHDLPSITASTYGTASYPVLGNRESPSDFTSLQRGIFHSDKISGAIVPTYNFSGVADSRDEPSFAQKYYQQFTETTYMSKRIVRVYLADTDENVPLGSSVLHSTQEKLTDLTDQELFFEIPIQEVLAKHNALRVTLLDKKQTARSGRDTFLEPVKIRDLKMSVVTVVSF